jgi:hypothetical protein
VNDAWIIDACRTSGDWQAGERGFDGDPPAALVCDGASGNRRAE